MINSIYADFRESARIAPKDSKLILRHSLRDKIPAGQMGEDILLTREGEVMAEHFGQHLNFEISRIHTSNIERCAQTARLIAKGYKDSKGKSVEILPTNMLASSYISDMAVAKRLFSEHSPYFIMQEFLRGKALSGMKPRDIAMGELFRYIFGADSMESKMEIFVTHDTFLIAIVCYCFGLQPDDDFRWPYMLEGAFLYYKDSRIYCIFRGEERSVEFGL